MYGKYDCFYCKFEAGLILKAQMLDHSAVQNICICFMTIFFKGNLFILEAPGKFFDFSDSYDLAYLPGVMSACTMYRSLF